MGKSKSGSGLPPVSSTGSAQPSSQTPSSDPVVIASADAVKSVFTQKDMERVSIAHGIAKDDIIVPGPLDRPHLLPPGFMAWTKTHCKCGAIPPLSTPFRNMLIKFGLSPFQLSPNSYSIIAGMYMLTRMVTDSGITPLELSFFYKLKGKKGSSFYNLEANSGVACVKHLKNKAGNWRNSWFFVRNPHNLPTSFQIPSELIGHEVIRHCH